TRSTRDWSSDVCSSDLEVLDHEREAAVVVHVGEEACPVGRQATHDGEEALVARVAAGAIVELGEARFVVGTDRPEAQTLAARQQIGRAPGRERGGPEGG